MLIGKKIEDVMKEQEEYENMETTAIVCLACGEVLDYVPSNCPNCNAKVGLQITDKG